MEANSKKSWHQDLRKAREAEPLGMQGGTGGCKPPARGSGGLEAPSKNMFVGVKIENPRPNFWQILVPKSWFWVHKIVFTGGLPPPRPPAVPVGLPAPQTAWQGVIELS